MSNNHFVLYVDEAGDPGLNRVRPLDENGSSEWFVLAGFLTRAHYEAEVVEWVKTIRQDIAVRQRADLHYRHLSPTKRRRACELVSKLPARSFVVASNRKNMRRYQNERAARAKSKQWFYNWCTRYLLERVSERCRLQSIKETGETAPLRVVFSERGGHDYDHTADYFERLRTHAKTGWTWLDKKTICPATIETKHFTTRQHKKVAGLQLADVVASAFYQAVDTHGPGRWSTEYAEILLPAMAKQNGVIADFGLALQPTPPWKAKLTEDQKAIFRMAGYAME